jgi:diguanylate cyclase (GGDEF)-like protein
LEQIDPKRVCSPGTMRLLVAGFGALLLLMVALVWLSITNIKAHQVRLDQVVSNHMAKVALANTMHTHARQRTTGLLRLLLNQDPFVQDEELQHFSYHAARFIEARNSLMHMHLSQQEKDLLAKQGKLTSQAVPLQKRIIALIEDQRYEEAKQLLNAKTIPAQDAVIAVVDKFYQFQLDAARKAQEQASRHVARGETVILLLGITAVTIGILITVVVIRSVRDRSARDAYLATHDPLTGLPNRTLLLDRLQQALKRQQRQGSKLGLLFIDVDKFKDINDSYGHAAGDQVLLTATQRIAHQLRDSDTLARLSGDEFVVLLHDVAQRAAVETTAQRIVESCGRPVTVAGQDIPLSVSVGIALCPDHGRSEDELLSHGDAAMYRSKQGGRNRWQVFHQGQPVEQP